MSIRVSWQDSGGALWQSGVLESRELAGRFQQRAFQRREKPSCWAWNSLCRTNPQERAESPFTTAWGGRGFSLRRHNRQFVPASVSQVLTVTAVWFRRGLCLVTTWQVLNTMSVFSDKTSACKTLPNMHTHTRMERKLKLLRVGFSP